METKQFQNSVETVLNCFFSVSIRNKMDEEHGCTRKDLRMNVSSKIIKFLSPDIKKLVARSSF